MARVVQSAAAVGVDAVMVQVEVDVSGGLPSVAVVGLADAAVREARVRVQAALQNAGFRFPLGRITVNLAPANLRKDGTGFDLPIALGILSAQDVIAKAALEDTLILGELSLEGDVRRVRGVLAAVEAAQRAGVRRALVPADNAEEAALVPHVAVHAVRCLADAVAFLNQGDERVAPRIARPSPSPATRCGEDLQDVRGQPLARRALEIAAAGGHHLLFVGGPGSGKTMLARRLPGILPPLLPAEALAVTRIRSVAGLSSGLAQERPFRAPHHSTSTAGLLGGGAGMPMPGELSFAHHGVLFLDELPEFQRTTLEILRQPLEQGDVWLSRAHGTVRFPAGVQLVCAMNPCPCGHYGDPADRCRCSYHEVMRYQGRVSGPLLDRIDLHVQVPQVPIEVLDSNEVAESSAAVRDRVIDARCRQTARFGDGGVNAQMTSADLRRWASLGGESQKLLRQAVAQLGISARGYTRVLRVARTIADLAGRERIGTEDIQEALFFRSGLEHRRFSPQRRSA